MKAKKPARVTSVRVSFIEDTKETAKCYFPNKHLVVSFIRRKNEADEADLLYRVASVFAMWMQTYGFEVTEEDIIPLLGAEAPQEFCLGQIYTVDSAGRREFHMEITL